MKILRASNRLSLKKERRTDNIDPLYLPIASTYSKRPRRTSGLIANAVATATLVLSYARACTGVNRWLRPFTTAIRFLYSSRRLGCARTRHAPPQALHDSQCASLFVYVSLTLSRHRGGSAIIAREKFPRTFSIAGLPAGGKSREAVASRVIAHSLESSTRDRDADSTTDDLATITRHDV